MATKQDALNWFRGQLGFVEGPNNATPYAELAGHANHQPWCATFLVAGFRAVGMTLPSESAYTPTMYNGLNKQGRIVGGPEVGALAFLHFPSMARIAHVGIVEEVRADGRFVTIEGNTDVAGGRTGGRVMRKVRSTIGWSFAMPAYDNTPAPVTPTPVSVPLVEDGDFGAKTITRLQQRLNETGAYPRLVVDGGFGENTKRALQARLNHVQGPVAIDGAFGRRSTLALQRYLNRVAGPCSADGDWGEKTTKCLQWSLNGNNGGF